MTTPQPSDLTAAPARSCAGARRPGTSELTRSAPAGIVARSPPPSRGWRTRLARRRRRSRCRGRARRCRRRRSFAASRSTTRCPARRALQPPLSPNLDPGLPPRRSRRGRRRSRRRPCSRIEPLLGAARNRRRRRASPSREAGNGAARRHRPCRPCRRHRGSATAAVARLLPSGAARHSERRRLRDAARSRWSAWRRSPSLDRAVALRSDAAGRRLARLAGLLLVVPRSRRRRGLRPVAALRQRRDAGVRTTALPARRVPFVYQVSVLDRAG